MGIKHPLAPPKIQTGTFRCPSAMFPVLVISYQQLINRPTLSLSTDQVLSSSNLLCWALSGTVFDLKRYQSMLVAIMEILEF